MAKSLRILHVFPSFELGGSQRRMTTYLNASNAPHNHLVYAMDDCYDAAELSHHFRAARIPPGLIPKGNLLSAILGCRKALQQTNPDLLVTYNWGSIEWAMANRWPQRCPTVHIQDGFGEDERDGENPRRQFMRKMTYSRCNRVIVPSNKLAALARESWKVPEKLLSYVPNGIDTTLFDRAADTTLTTSFGLSHSTPVIGTVARLTPEKNIGRLIEAFSKIENKHSDARLVIVGDGVGMAALKMLAERICVKGRVIFTGTINEPQTIVPAFDIFALSSDTEQMPISVLEAMAAGKAIASTDVGDTKHMVSEGNQRFIKGRKADELADSLDALLSDPSLAKSLGEANKSLVRERFSLDTMVETYDRLFIDAVSR